MPYTISIPAALLAVVLVGTLAVSNGMTAHDADWLAALAQAR